MSSRIRLDPADAFALAEALSRDEQRSARERREQDSRVAPVLALRSEDRTGVLHAWLLAVEAEDASVAQVREQTRQTENWISALLFLLGGLMGMLATWAALFFDGSGRINVISVFALLVLLPGLFLLPFVFAALPAHWSAVIPGGRLFSQLFRFFNPGGLGLWVARKLPGSWKERGLAFMGQSQAMSLLYRRMLKWMVLRWSQFFALGFQLVALGSAIWLVVFSDLAFGWSTTLTSGAGQTDAARMHQVVEGVALPWSWAIPSAVPDLGLIQESRYFRAASGPLAPEDAARLGNWWPFVVATLLVYGLLPRLLTFAICGFRLRAAVASFFLTYPGASSLFGRFHRAAIVSSSDSAGESADSSVVSGEEAPAGLLDVDSLYGAINWASVPVDDANLGRWLGVDTVVHAGGSRTLNEDMEVIQSLQVPHGKELALVVKAWEPPLHECMDFLRELRRHLGPDVEMRVFPVSPGTGKNIAAPPPAQFAVWKRRIEQEGDPRLRVVSGFGSEVGR